MMEKIDNPFEVQIRGIYEKAIKKELPRKRYKPLPTDNLKKIKEEKKEKKERKKSHMGFKIILMLVIIVTIIGAFYLISSGYFQSIINVSQVCPEIPDCICPNISIPACPDYNVSNPINVYVNGS